MNGLQFNFWFFFLIFDSGSKVLINIVITFYFFLNPFRLNHTYRQLLRENESLQSDHKNLKSSLNNGKLEQTRLEADFSKLKEKYQKSDITVTNLTNQCEVSIGFITYVPKVVVPTGQTLSIYPIRSYGQYRRCKKNLLIWWIWCNHK